MEVTGQWADSLAGLERLFYLRLLVWGALSLLLGSFLLLYVRRSAEESRILESFAFALLGGGASEIAAALIGRETVALRDLGAATSLDRTLWLAAGIAIGWAIAALLVGACAWLHRGLARRSMMLGACLGVALHGAAIALLCLQLGTSIVR